MRARIFSGLICLSTLIALAIPSLAAADGSCVARHGDPGYSAYCQSFDETPCRMNSSYCFWIPDMSDGGSCQPRDRSNPAYAAYCESFDQNACQANVNLCVWW